MAAAMREGGCINVGFGVETTDGSILKAIKKGETIAQIERAVAIAKKYFRRVNGFFIIGLPGSSYEKDIESLRWALERGINAHFSYYVPPGRADDVFWGESARPLSEEYPAALQRRLYELTRGMRGEAGPLGKAFLALKTAWLADRKNFLGHAMLLFKGLKERDWNS
jgi:hypothetical protein